MDEPVQNSVRGASKAFPGFEEKTLPHLKPLFRLALRLTGDPAAAEDLVQETYLKALQSFSTLRDPERVRPWLFQILSRLVIDRHRSAPREVPLERPDELDRFSLYDRIADEDPLPYSDSLHDEFLAQFPDESACSSMTP
jgi:RNA polymerase sigma-70 factor (ECF subfamily)